MLMFFVLTATYYRMEEFKMMNLDIRTILEKAIELPLVRIERNDFLKKEFSAPKYENIIDEIIKRGPGKAGVTPEDLKRHAKNAINLETTKATTLSFVSGLPGGPAMIGTIPADICQFYGHVLRVIQKLMYLYGWGNVESMDEGTTNIVIIFLGVMNGVEAAQQALKQLCVVVSERTTSMIAAKALTRAALYPTVKKVGAQISIKITNQATAKMAAKIIPVVGGIASGGLTIATFKPMSHRLLKELIENSRVS